MNSWSVTWLSNNIQLFLVFCIVIFKYFSSYFRVNILSFRVNIFFFRVNIFLLGYVRDGNICSITVNDFYLKYFFSYLKFFKKFFSWKLKIEKPFIYMNLSWYRLWVISWYLSWSIFFFAYVLLDYQPTQVFSPKMDTPKSFIIKNYII